MSKLMQRNIYVAHATSFDYQQQLYAPLLTLEIADINFILLHKITEQTIHSKNIIANCHAVIAEISHPSIGIGIELGWANMFEKPIYCLYKTGSRYSTSLTEISNYVRAYANTQEILNIILSVLWEIN